jgi:hypothetical protein
MPCSALLAPPMERARSGPAAHSSPSGSRAPFCACTRVLYHHSARAVAGPSRPGREQRPPSEGNCP